MQSLNPLISSSMGTTLASWKNGGMDKTKPQSQHSLQVVWHAPPRLQEQTLHTTYVWSKFNPAYGSSRGLYPSPILLSPPIPLPLGINKFLIDSEEPPSPTKQRLLCEGVYPTAIAKVINAVNEQDKAYRNFGINNVTKFIPHAKEHQWEWFTVEQCGVWEGAESPKQILQRSKQGRWTVLSTTCSTWTDAQSDTIMSQNGTRVQIQSWLSG